MPTRTKHDAELRLSMGAARIAMRDGKSPEEAVRAVRAHRDVMASLDRPIRIGDKSPAPKRRQAR